MVIWKRFGIRGRISDPAKQMSRIWSRIKPETIDYGIMEKARDIFVIPATDLGWNDVGSWSSLFEFLTTDDHGNILLGSEVIWQETEGFTGCRRKSAQTGCNDRLEGYNHCRYRKSIIGLYERASSKGT